MLTTQNKEFSIELEANPTTGYAWELLNDPNIKLISKIYIPNNTNNKFVGNGGHEVFNLLGINPGTYIIKFEYKRPWESSPLHFKDVEIEIS